jgi:hypothetical protein
MVPALYAGVALLIDRAIRLGRDAFARQRWAMLAIAMLVLLVQLRLFSDIFARGRVQVETRRASTDKHQLDDREAVRWLRSQWKPGDVLMTTGLALPAVWWYWMIPISDEAGAGSVLPDGSPVYEAIITDCVSPQLGEVLKKHPRVLLYLGFDVIPGFDRALLSNLAQLGGMTAYREFFRLGRAAVIDLRVPASGSILRLDRTTTPEHLDAGLCVGVRRAERW